MHTLLDRLSVKNGPLVHTKALCLCVGTFLPHLSLFPLAGEDTQQTSPTQGRGLSFVPSVQVQSHGLCFLALDHTHPCLARSHSTALFGGVSLCFSPFVWILTTFILFIAPVVFRPWFAFCHCWVFHRNRSLRSLEALMGWDHLGYDFGSVSAQWVSFLGPLG